MVEYGHVLVPIIGLTMNVFVQVFGFRTLSGLTLLKSVIIGFVSGFVSVMTLEYYCVAVLSVSTSDVLSGFMTNLLIYTALGYCYFHFLNLGETARRIRILRELYEVSEGLSLEEILERYNAKHIVATRIRRLVHNGQVVERYGRYYIGSPVMLFIARSITLLKLCIFGKRSEFD
jgi:hypothetical protein